MVNYTVLEEKLTEIALSFSDRLGDIWIESVLDYISHNEFGLAFDILCDYLIENNVTLTTCEYENIISFAHDLKYSLDCPYLEPLKQLIV